MSENAMVFVVDDDASVRTSLRRLLASEGYQVQTFSSTSKVFQSGRPDSPSCLILDVHMPEVDGMTYQEMLRNSGVRIPVIFITGWGDIPMSVRAIKGGAIDFLQKPFDRSELLRCVRTAILLDAQLLEEDRQLAELKRRYSTLTPRESEVFAAVSSGRLNKQVGYELGVVEKTIKVHRAHVMEKMGANSLVDLVQMAGSLGIHEAKAEFAAQFA